jgi:hypothetical protein
VITMESVVVASQDHVSSPLGDELVVLDTQSGVYYGLNALGAFIWMLIQKPTPVITLRDAIMGEFEVEREVCERDLLSILADMQANNLVSVRHASD